MASPISKDLREHALPKGEGGRQTDFGTPPLVRRLKVWTVITSGGAIVLLTLAHVLGLRYTVLAAIVCTILATAGGILLGVNALLADRQEFWRRGQLDGWMRGWRGQEPEVDDPLLHLPGARSH